jgi:hypothetical protein
MIIHQSCIIHQSSFPCACRGDRRVAAGFPGALPERGEGGPNPETHLSPAPPSTRDLARFGVLALSFPCASDLVCASAHAASGASARFRRPRRGAAARGGVRWLINRTSPPPPLNEGSGPALALGQSGDATSRRVFGSLPVAG